MQAKFPHESRFYSFNKTTKSSTKVPPKRTFQKSERSELSAAGLALAAEGGISASSNKVDYCNCTFIISKQLANKREGSSDEKLELASLVFEEAERGN